MVMAADDTVSVWAADAELLPGAALSDDTLSPVPVRLEGEVSSYLTGPVPDGFVLVRPVGQGELVPASAVASRAELTETVRLVAVSPAADTVPGALSTGDRVDVWVGPDALGEPDDPAVLLVAGVDVATVPLPETGFGASADGERVVLSLERGSKTPAELTDLTARMVAASAAGRVVLTVDPAPR